MQLAALLHDADDRKYFEKGSNNSTKIMEESLEDHTAKN
jgi:hypothetical protein